MTEAQATIRCRSCGHTSHADRRFCARCGSPLEERCPACGTVPDPEARFCGRCGAPLGAGMTAPAGASPDAERRHLTVMFVDLVASTTLAERIDDEDLRDVIRRYYDACADTARRYEGHVANYLGDGILLYFGYPRAHEDDAERAVRAGLDMLARLERDVDTVNATLTSERGGRLAARIGIHTGPVVVGDLGGGTRREDLALGETMNLAARLQSVAAPDTVVISDATRRLVRGIFVLEDLGPQRLKGITTEVVAYRVVQPSGVRSRLDLAEGRLTPFTGRGAELGVLLDCWERTQEHQGQTVLVSGEAGIGKSRLVLALRERLADQPHTWLECRCSPYTQHTAFRPVVELVEQGLAFQAADTAEEKIGKLERALRAAGLSLPDTVPLFAEFLSIPPSGAYAPLHLTPDVQRRKTLETLAAWNLALGEIQPVLLLVEDLHWCDPSSLELLARLIEQSPTARLMLVCTARPEFQSPWPARSNLTPLQLARLTRRQAREMVAALSVGGTLPESVVDLVVTRADGVPLYLEELVRTVLESRRLLAGDGEEAPRTELAIPATLHDSLVARLDRLSAAKEVVQRAAVLGREFSYALLARTAGLDEQTLHHGLVRLVEEELLFQRGEPPAASYIFNHALIQEAAYQSLLRRTRRQLHARVAQVLLEEFPTQAAAVPEVVARHYEAAGLVERAVAHYRQAGEHAVVRSAHAEALSHFRKGIALLAELPEGTDRVAREIPLQLALGPSVVAAQGWGHPDFQAALERALALCGPAGDRAQRANALAVLSSFHANSGNPQRGIELARVLFDIARETGDSEHLLLAHVQMGVPEYYQGRFASALAHFEEAIAVYDPAQHGGMALKYASDHGVAARANAGWNLWYLGHPDRALERAREAVALARTLGHPFSLGLALFVEAVVHCLRRDRGAQRRIAEEAIALGEAHGVPLWTSMGKVFRGHARVTAEADATGVVEITEALALGGGTGMLGGAPAMSLVLADAQFAVGQLAEAQLALDMGMAIAAQTGQPFCDAELQRGKGELVLAASGGSAGDEAEAFFARALEIARAQEARGFELRGATSLARLLRARGRSDRARAVLEPVYARFTEGFDTEDLREAKAVLEELAIAPGSPTPA